MKSTKFIFVLTTLASGPAFAQSDVPEYEYRDPVTLYRFDARGLAPNGYKTDWNSACAAAVGPNQCNGSNPKICILGGTGAYKDNYGPGCWYRVTYENAGGVYYDEQLFYQMWAYPRPMCPPISEGWIHETTTGQCRRIVVPQYQKNLVCPDSNPVYASDGSKRQREEDFFYQSFGQRMSFARALYTNSLIDYERAYGQGWFLDKWGRSLGLKNVASPGIVLATRGPGQTFALKSDASGVWKTTPYDGIEIKQSTGGWILSDRASGSVELYDQDGKLLSYWDVSGQVTSLSYSTINTPLSIAPFPGLLIGLSSPGGEDVGIKYNASGQIAEVSLRGAFQTGYAYDSARPDLQTDVLFANGTKRSYSYSSSLNPLLSIPSDDYLIQKLSTPGPIPSAQQYKGASSAPVMAQLVTGRANRSGFTGITDEAGRPYATYSYDDSGRLAYEYHGQAVSTYHFTYDIPLTQSTVEDDRGGISVRKYKNIRGTLRLESQSQAAGSGCNATTSQVLYDAQGNIKSEVDFGAVRTCHSYDSNRNVETYRLEGLSDSAADEQICNSNLAAYQVPAGKLQRKISTQWHPKWKLVTRLAEPKRITTTVYNGEVDPISQAVLDCAAGDPRLPDDVSSKIAVVCRRYEQSTDDDTGNLGFTAPVKETRVWNYAYSQYGQVTQEVDPRGKPTTYEYWSGTSFTGERGHSLGDLKTVTNALNQTTNYLEYNKRGQVLTTQLPNGSTEQREYHVRGWLTKVTQVPAGSGVGQTTQYDYYPTGLLKQVTQPDGSWAYYTWDDAHRLTDVADSVGNSVHYELDNAGNRTAEQFKDPQGTLAKTITRTFDALGRMQSASGVQ